MNIAYDLFLLTFNLSQLHDRERIIQLFLEGLQEIFNQSEFAFSDNPVVEGEDFFEIKSRQNHYGYIKFKRNGLISGENHVLFCNAVQMVAVIIDNLEYSTRLEVEKDKLHSYAEMKLTELKNTVKDLEEARKASINLIEDLSEEIEKRKIAEALIRESEEKFRNLFEHSPVGKSMTGIDGSINVNKSFCDLLGYTSDELKSKNWKEISHPEDVPIAEEIVKSLVSGTSDSARFEKRYIHKNGSTIYTDVSTYLQRDNNGKPEYFITTINDISDRKLAESKLLASQERFALVISASEQGIWDWNVETNDVFFSEQWKRQVGYDDHEIKNDFNSWIELLHPDDKESCLLAVQSYLNNPAEHFILEFRFRHKDGSYRVIHNKSASVKGENGRITRMFGTHTDITERKQAEEALKIKDHVFENSLASQSIADIAGLITHVNEAFLQLWGYKIKEQAIGLSVGSFFANPDDATLVINALDAHDSWEGEFLAKRADGTTFISQGFATSLRNGHGDFIGYQSTNLNVTNERESKEEIKKLNATLEQRVFDRTAQLESANKELEAFSYSVSHDLRAPLRAIHSFTTILREDYEETLGIEGKRICGIIEKSSVHMGQLIDDLLAFSRIGRTELKFSKIDMTKLAKTIYSESIDEKLRESIDFKISKLPSSYGDLTAVRQVLVNLISNAIKYTSKTEKPSILIGSDKVGGEVVYFVKDNGVGFDMQYVNKLFGVFQRLHSAKEFEGNGVGLAIVQRIIHRHGGKVWAEGEVGKGATFYFTLPEKKNSH